MKMRVALAVAGLAFGAFLGSAVAQAATYDLATDFGTANTVGSPWSITYSGGTLPTQSAVGSNGNHLEPAIPGAYFGTGTNLNNDTPFAFKPSINGSGVSGLNDEAFHAGDVVIHTPNDGTDLTITWTAPSAGTIDNLDFDIWYAHTNVTRSNDVNFTLGAIVSDFVTSTASNTGRSTGGTQQGNGIVVAAGDLLTLTFAKTVGQTFGSLSGLNLSFDFTATAVTPIPAALPLFVSALAGLGWCARRRRQPSA
jgi:hypothetical protein